MTKQNSEEKYDVPDQDNTNRKKASKSDRAKNIVVILAFLLWAIGIGVKYICNYRDIGRVMIIIGAFTVSGLMLAEYIKTKNRKRKQ